MLILLGSCSCKPYGLGPDRRWVDVRFEILFFFFNVAAGARFLDETGRLCKADVVVTVMACFKR